MNLEFYQGMFESVVASVLNNVLGSYIANLETKQLNIGIWKGDVSLKNLTIREDALDKLNLPISIKKGTLGTLVLKIPWKNLKNEPVKLFLSDLYFTAVDTVLTKEKYEDRLYRAKMSSLETIAPVESQSSSFLSQLATKIVDNIQIFIENIHVCYESQGRTLGITLNELKVVSTDSNWEEAFLHGSVDVIHKLVRLENLAVFYNMDNEQRYLLNPVTASMKLELDKQKSTTESEIKFETVGLQLDNEQYEHLISLTKLFSTVPDFDKPDESAEVKPRLWWKYLFGKVNQKIHKRRTWTIQFFEERFKDKRLFIDLEKKRLNNSDYDKVKLEALQRKLTQFDLSIWKKEAQKEVKSEKKPGWFDWWHKEKVTEEDMKELYRTIDYQEDTEELQHRIKFTLETGFFTVLQVNEKKSIVTKFSFFGLDVSLSLLQKGLSVKWTLADLVLFDGNSASKYPEIIRSKTDKFLELSLVKDYNSETTAHLNLKMDPLEVVLNVEYIKKVKQYFGKHFDSEIVEMAEEQAKQLSKASLEYIQKMHRTLDFNVDICAPIIYIPENCLEYSGFTFILNLGHLKSFSQLVEPGQASLYDKFTVYLNEAELLYKSNTVQQTVIDNIDVQLNIEKCITTANNLTMFKVQGNLPKLSISMSPEKLNSLLKTIDSFSTLNSSSEEKSFVPSRQVDEEGDEFFDAKSTEQKIVELGFEIGIIEFILFNEVDIGNLSFQKLKLDFDLFDDKLNAIFSLNDCFLTDPRRKAYFVTSKQNSYILKVDYKKRVDADYLDIDVTSLCLYLEPISLIGLVGFFTSISSLDSSSTKNETLSKDIFLKAHLSELDLTLIDNEVFSVISFRAAKVESNIGNEMKICGLLESLSVTDSNLDKVLWVVGDKLVDVEFTTKGINQYIKLSGASVVFDYNPFIVQSFSKFVEKLSTLKSPSLKVESDSLSKTFLRIAVESPSVILKDDKGNKLIADLGSLLVKNEFDFDSNNIEIYLSQIGLKTIFEEERQVVSPVDVNLMLCIGNVMHLSGSVSPIEFDLLFEEYELLLGRVFHLIDTIGGEPERESVQTTENDSSIDIKVSEDITSEVRETDTSKDVNLKVDISIPEISLLCSTKNSQSDFLAKFSLKEMQIRAETRTDSTFEAAVSIEQSSATDFLTKESIYRQVLKTNHPILIQYSKMDAGAHLKIDIRNLEMVYVSEFVFQVKDYFVNGLPQETKGANLKSQSFTSVTLLETELFLVDDLASKGEAVRFLVPRIFVSQSENALVSIDKVQASFTNMELLEFQNFVEPIDLSLTMEFSPEKTTMWFTCSPIVLRLTVLDLDFLLGVVQKIAPAKEEEIIYDDLLLDEIKVQVEEKLFLDSLDISVLIIDDWHDLMLPLFDFRMPSAGIQVMNWSSVLNVKVSSEVFVNYYNIKVSHWEPLVEHWQFSLLVEQDAATKMILESDKLLNVNCTKSFLEFMSRLSMKPKPDRSKKRNLIAPYLIKNQTGFKISIWSEATEMLELDFGDQIEWSFENETKENKINVHIHAEWESIKDITVSREGTRTYPLLPKVNDISFKLVSQIELQENIKIVTLCSQIRFMNETDFDFVFEICEQLMECKSKESLFVPLNLIGYEMRLWPFGDEYKPSQKFGPIIKTANLVTCNSLSPNLASFKVYLYPKIRNDAMTIYLHPPMIIENLIPHKIKYRLIDREQAQSISGNLEQGRKENLNVVDLRNMIAMEIQICNTTYNPSELCIVNNVDDDKVDEKLIFYDTHGLKLSLGVSYSSLPNSCCKVIHIYAPYILMNSSFLPLVYRPETVFRSQKLAAGQSNVETGKFDSSKTELLMFSYSNYEPTRNRIAVSVNSEWSRPFSLDAVGSSFEIDIADKYNLGVSIRQGKERYFRSKIITFTPRYNIYNKSSHLIQIQLGKTEIDLQKGMKTFFHISSHEEKVMRVFTETGFQSVAFYNIGQVYVKHAGAQLLLFEIDVEGSSMLITVSDCAQWPYKIVNNTLDSFRIGQKSTKTTYDVEPKSKLPFSWDVPSGSQMLELFFISADQVTSTLIKLNEIGMLKPVVVGSTVYSLRVVAEGPIFVLLINYYEEEKSIYKKKEDLFDVKSVEAIDLFSFTIKLSLGISLIDSNVEELAYIQARGLEFKYHDYNLYTTFGLSVDWLQVDNQILNAHEPIIFYPAILKRSSHKSFLSIALTKSKDNSYGVDYYKYFALLMQEATIELDEEFLLALLDFVDLPSAAEEVELLDKEPAIWHKLKITEQMMYFELFHVHPLRLNISFSKTRVAQKQASQTYNPLKFLLDILVMTLGNVHDASLKLNALILEDPVLSKQLLQQLILDHYTDDAIGQLHKVIGSADALGNPVGLFNSFSSGVTDLFYEPYQGLVSDRPQDFGVGLAKGGASLVKNTVFGISDSLSKVTGSLGKGLSALSMDPEFQEQRKRMKRNKPKHALYGVTSGAKSLLRGIASGVTGIVERPMEGAKHGVGGFFKGIGKGLVGVVAKPVVGVLDMASNVTEGMRNTTTVFDSELDKSRLPRAIPANQILQAYSSRAAIGQAILHSLNLQERYISHVDIPSARQILLVSTDSLILVRLEAYKLVWIVPFRIVLRITRQDDKIIVLCQDKADSKYIECKDEMMRTNVYDKLLSAFNDFRK